MGPRLRREQHPHRPPWLAVAGVVGATGVAAAGTRLLAGVVRRHDAKVIAEHERARKLAKKATKKTKKATKKLAKAKPSLPAPIGDRGLVRGHRSH